MAGGRTDNEEISTSEIFEIGGNGFVEGPNMPDSQFNWGSTLISTLDKLVIIAKRIICKNQFLIFHVFN